MWKTVMTGLLVGHGLVHVLGFVVPWRLANVPTFPYSTKAFFGRLDMGEGGTRVLGMMWLLAAGLFVYAGVGAWTGAEGWYRVALSTAGLSAVLCILWLPRTTVGLLVNAAIAALTLVPAVRDLGG